MTSKTEEQATATAQEPQGTRKANVAPRKPRVAHAKGKAGKKATPAKKAPKGAKAAKPSTTAARAGSKTATVLDLVKRPGGATLKELMKVTGWQAHSVRGFLSGAIGKKMGLAVTSTKEDGERRYAIKC